MQYSLATAELDVARHASVLKPRGHSGAKGAGKRQGAIFNGQYSMGNIPVPTKASTVVQCLKWRRQVRT